MTFLPSLGSRGTSSSLELGLELGELRFLRRDLGLEVLAHLGVGLAREHLARVGEVASSVPRYARYAVDDRLAARAWRRPASRAACLVARTA